MGAFEYLLLFAAVILGLAISHLAISLHRLLNAGKEVKWDALPLLAAALAFERIVAEWWVWHSANRLAAGFTFGMFLGVLLSAVLLFLMAAVALPDESGERIDLRAHYLRTHRRYWLLFAAQWLTLNVVSIWAQSSIGQARINLVSTAWLILPAAIALALIRQRIVQYVGLIGFLVFYGVTYFGRTLA